MITEKVGNLLEAPVEVIVHQANLYHTFGSGIAAAIRKAFPEAFEADLATVKGDHKKLGTFSIGKITEPKGAIIRVVNMYSQIGIGGSDRNTSYDYMVSAMERLRTTLEDAASKGHTYKLGIPFQIGCGLANGNWGIVRAILEEVWGKSAIETEIYTLPELVKP